MLTKIRTMFKNPENRIDRMFKELVKGMQTYTSEDPVEMNMDCGFCDSTWKVKFAGKTCGATCPGCGACIAIQLGEK